MASVRLIPEDEATGKVKTIYDEIKAQLGIDFVPNLCLRPRRDRLTRGLGGVASWAAEVQADPVACLTPALRTPATRRTPGVDNWPGVRPEWRPWVEQPAPVGERRPATGSAGCHSLPKRPTSR